MVYRIPMPCAAGNWSDVLSPTVPAAGAVADATTTCLSRSHLHRDVCDYTDEAREVFCGPSTASAVIATLRPLPRACVTDGGSGR
jgi:hypothetical protein